MNIAIQFIALVIAHERNATSENNYLCTQCGVYRHGRDCCLGICPSCEQKNFALAASELLRLEREAPTLVAGLRLSFDKAREARQQRLGNLAKGKTAQTTTLGTPTRSHTDGGPRC